MRQIKCLITAGATREYFDPVRFISNPSTGKMGIAIAKACKDSGWETTLVIGAASVPTPDGIETISAISAEDMLRETSARFSDCDILIMTAAVSDMRPKVKSAQKVKKEKLNMLVEFEQTPDILKTLSKSKNRQILIGFAAETNDVETYAKKKLKEKNLDAIAANNVSKKDAGFASDFNEISLFFKDGKTAELGRGTKDELAQKLVKILSEKFFS
ncbi:MAG: phosphopantothenoylcysteine decarboxylase [Opitutales bacterium]|nr:phosphopantothenoylcysteine decarboxylase [Opitutales bacterium]